MESAREAARFSVAIVLHGVGTGGIGAAIALLIRTVQQVGYGNNKGGFLEIALATPPWRRLVCCSIGGVFGAFAWFWLRARKEGIVGVQASLKGKVMPPLVTIVNGMIQDIVVALGGSFGREAAPREIAAMWGGSLSDLLGCDAQDRRLLVACGTGAGLAAVYSVPISGTLYTLEHVLEWELSAKNVIAAMVTSVIATYVASVEVEAKALYEMPKYSYDWPSPKMILWSALIGPLAGLAAMVFRRLIKFVEKFKPNSRFSVDFEDVKLDQKVCISDRWGKVVARPESPEWVVDILFDEDARESFNLAAYTEAKPVGERDWRILAAMPTVFLALGMVACKMPTVLGNGRALAQVAIARARSTYFFTIVLIMKVFLTAASIGTGAAGGTLTPSVAIGATFGAILGEEFQYYFPNLAPDLDAPMSVISAASFLSVAMMSPFTGLFLLLEFSGQGVDKRHLRAALIGDFSGVIKSKLAIGMLVPMVLAVAGGTLAVHGAGKMWDRIRPAPPPPRPIAPPRTHRAKSSDLDLQEQDDEFEHHIHLEKHEQQGLFICFRAGLMTNTWITVIFGLGLSLCPEKVADLSVYGLPLAFIVGVVGWTLITRRIMASPRTKDSIRIAYNPLQTDENEEVSHNPSRNYLHDYRHKVYGGMCAVGLAVLGAVAPLVPWVIKVWSFKGKTDYLIGVISSVLGAVTVSTCVRIYLEPSVTPDDKEHAISGTQVIRQLVLDCLMCIVAAAVGAWCGQMDWFPTFWQCDSD